MKKLFIVSVMLSIYTIAFCQNCQCVIVGENNKFKYAFDGCCTNDKNNASLQKNSSLVIDSITGAYLIAEIISNNNDCFLVNFMPSDEESSLVSKDSVWVAKSNIAIGLRGHDYKGMSKIPLYNYPDYNAMHGLYVVNTAYLLAQVTEYKDRWLKICLENNGTVVIGWLAPENQCTNMYTMCMGE